MGHPIYAVWVEMFATLDQYIEKLAELHKYHEYQPNQDENIIVDVDQALVECQGQAEQARETLQRKFNAVKHSFSDRD